MKNINQAFFIWYIRKVKLRIALKRTKSIKDRKRIILLCHELQCRKDNLFIFNGGSLPNFNIFEITEPIWA